MKTGNLCWNTFSWEDCKDVENDHFILEYFLSFIGLFQWCGVKPGALGTASQGAKPGEGGGGPEEGDEGDEQDDGEAGAANILPEESSRQIQPWGGDHGVEVRLWYFHNNVEYLVGIDKILGILPYTAFILYTLGLNSLSWQLFL